MILGLLASGALAHPDADERFQRRGEELAAEGEACVPEVWLERARALAAERRMEESLAAVGRAEGCGASAVELSLARGLLLAPRSPAEALPWLDAALRVQPDHAGALAARADAKEALGRPDEAARDLARALRSSASPAPDQVLRLARLRADQGDLEAALEALDDAPPSPALVEAAVELELRLGRPEAALGRLDAMPDTPFWAALRARVEAP